MMYSALQVGLIAFIDMIYMCHQIPLAGVSVKFLISNIMFIFVLRDITVVTEGQARGRYDK